MTESVTAQRESQLPFYGILGEKPQGGMMISKPEEPAYFSDLKLSPVLESVVAGYEEHEIAPLFYEKLTSIDDIYYRHEVFRDLENRELFTAVTTFSDRMRDLRRYLALSAKVHYKYLSEGWFLYAVEVYCDTVSELTCKLATANVTSRGFLAFRDYLSSYVASPAFTSLAAETQGLKEELSRLRYCIHIKGNRVRVRKYRSEVDYSAEVLKTFKKFRQGAAKDYLVDFPESAGMNHVEAAILERVALLFEEVFLSLDDFFINHRDFVDGIIRDFDREVQFYIAYLEFIDEIRRAGLSFCYPEVSASSKEVFADETFDLALAAKLVPEGSRVVCNDFYLHEPERIFVVTGPNQGGKTTFARTFGQLHHLCGIGCPVPGSKARLFLFDRLFTHFEREEDLENLVGKLEDDLVRIIGILNNATSDSILIINEIFTSTTLKDALFLGRKLMERMIQLGVLGVLVTFADELTLIGDSTVSMVSTVVPENPVERTYKIVRRPADGLAYALAIAEKHGLTYERLKMRIAP